jgi:hypothetical protein
MAYNKFTLKSALQRFNLSIQEIEGLFAAAPPVSPSPLLQELMSEYQTLATSINTEKARSELLISPVLMDVRRQLDHRISVFSGINFEVDKSQGLTGYCDYILSSSPVQQFLTAPVIAIAEAKNDNPHNGFGQCIAVMVGAQLFNEQDGTPQEMIYGVSTTGMAWRFLQLQGKIVTLDLTEYSLSDIELVLGILIHLIGKGK